MSDSKFVNVIAQIARKNHTTPEKVRAQIQYAMDMAMKSSDPGVQARWASIPRKGDRLTLEEFVSYLVYINGGSFS